MTVQFDEARRSARAYLLRRTPLKVKPQQKPRVVEEFEPVAARYNEKGLISKQIMTAVAECAGVRVDELKAPRRDRKLVAARQAAMFLLLKRCVHLNNSSIGRILNRDPSTVHHGIRCVKANPERYQHIIKAVEDRL